MRTPYLLLSLSIAFACFSVLLAAPPLLAGERPALQQDSGGDAGGDAGAFLNVYVLEDGQVLIQPAEEPCPECGDDQPGQPGLIPPPFPRLPFTRPTPFLTGPSIRLKYATVPGVALLDGDLSVARTPGAIIIDGVSGLDCVDKLPAGAVAVAAGSMPWAGFSECPGTTSILPLLTPESLVEAANGAGSGITSTSAISYNQAALLPDGKIAIYGAVGCPVSPQGSVDPNCPRPCLYPCCLAGRPGIICDQAPPLLVELQRELQRYIENLFPNQ